MGSVLQIYNVLCYIDLLVYIALDFVFSVSTHKGEPVRQVNTMVMILTAVSTVCMRVQYLVCEGAVLGM